MVKNTGTRILLKIKGPYNRKAEVVSKGIAHVIQTIYFRFSVTPSLVWKDGDAVPVQRIQGATIGKMTTRNVLGMYQTVIHSPTEDQSERWPAINNNCSRMKKDNKEGRGQRNVRAAKIAWSAFWWSPWQ